jgi:tetratricopeptide (TPR) repeat protein
MKPERYVPWLIVAVGLVAYFNTFHNEFIFDDQGYIVENPHIRKLWPPTDILWHSTRPVVNFTFAVNYSLGKLNPWGYHVGNLAIHLTAGLLLYGIVRRSMQSPRLQWKHARLASWLAGIVALLWVVHPLQTESVSYTWQRCESLVGLFYLLTLYGVIRGHDSRRAVAWGAVSVVSCALGMATKEVMVTAPVVVLLYDRVFLAASWQEIGRRRWGLYVGLAATWLLLVALLHRGTTSQEIWIPTADVTYRGIQPHEYLLTQSGVIMHYLRQAMWPNKLCLDYGTSWPVARSAVEVWPSLTAVAGMLLGTAWACWRHPAVGFLGAAFFLMLAPTSSFVPITDVVFEHRMYLPLAAVIVLGTVVGVEILDRLPVPPRVRNWGAVSAAALLACTLVLLTMKRNEDYQSELTIWRDTVQKRPENARAHYNLGVALSDRGHREEAIPQYEAAVQIKADYAEAHNNWANALNSLGQPENAIGHCIAALRINPQHFLAQNNWGNALHLLGHYAEAIGHYQSALEIKPDYADAHFNWGNALLALRRPLEAIGQYRKALQFKPDDEQIHFSWGNALQLSGDYQAAIDHYEQAIRIKPEYAEALCNWGKALNALNRPQQAILQCKKALQIDSTLASAHVVWAAALNALGQSNDARFHCEEALRLDPDSAEAHYYLGNAWHALKRPQEALAQYQEALRIRPDYPEAHFNLGATLATQGNLREAAAHFRQALQIRPDYSAARNALLQVEALLKQQSEPAER